MTTEVDHLEKFVEYESEATAVLVHTPPAEPIQAVTNAVLALAHAILALPEANLMAQLKMTEEMWGLGDDDEDDE